MEMYEKVMRQTHMGKLSGYEIGIRETIWYTTVN